MSACKYGYMLSVHFWMSFNLILYSAEDALFKTLGRLVRNKAG